MGRGRPSLLLRGLSFLNLAPALLKTQRLAFSLSLSASLLLCPCLLFNPPPPYYPSLPPSIPFAHCHPLLLFRCLSNRLLPQHPLRIFARPAFTSNNCREPANGFHKIKPLRAPKSESIRDWLEEIVKKKKKGGGRSVSPFCVLHLNLLNQTSSINTQPELTKITMKTQSLTKDLHLKAGGEIVGHFSITKIFLF